MRLIMDMC